MTAKREGGRGGPGRPLEGRAGCWGYWDMGYGPEGSRRVPGAGERSGLYGGNLGDS